MVDISDEGEMTEAYCWAVPNHGVMFTFDESSVSWCKRKLGCNVSCDVSRIEPSVCKYSMTEDLHNMIWWGNKIDTRLI